MLNVLTIDIEDYWSIFSRDWLGIDAEPTTAVLKNTEWFLETLERLNVKATVFVLGEVAKRFPRLIRKVAEAGHEIGSHGLYHKQIFKLNQEQFRSEIADSKKLLEDITSGSVSCYRAPAFSITPQTKWALGVLAEEGFAYDSSIFPIAGRRYGWPGFSKRICKLNLPGGRSIVEVPLSTVRILGKDWPVGGGGYLRHLPYGITRWALRHIQKQRPAVVYMHPYEIDTEPRALDAGELSYKEQKNAVRHHKMQLRNRNTVCQKVIKLLSEFQFGSIGQVLEETVLDSHRIR